MPCLEITLPQTDDATRARLAAALTDAFCETTGHPKEIFGVRFDEYAPGQCAVGGAIWHGGEGAPYLHLILYSGRLRRAQKQQLVERLSAAFAAGVGDPSWIPVIHLAEHPYENVGVEGELLADTHCQGRGFYYELSDS